MKRRAAPIPVSFRRLTRREKLQSPRGRFPDSRAILGTEAFQRTGRLQWRDRLGFTPSSPAKSAIFGDRSISRRMSRKMVTRAESVVVGEYSTYNFFIGSREQ